MDSQSHKQIEEIIAFYKENWKYLTMDCVIHLADFLYGIAVDRQFSRVLKKTQEQEDKYWANRIDQMYEIMRQFERYLNRLKEKGKLKPVNKGDPLKFFLGGYKEISEAANP